MDEKELVGAVIEKSGLAPEQAEETVHAVVETVLREFEKGEPTLDMEPGTLNLVIDEQTLVKSLVDKAYVSATEAQALLETVVELLVRV